MCVYCLNVCYLTVIKYLWKSVFFCFVFARWHEHLTHAYENRHKHIRTTLTHLHKEIYWFNLISCRKRWVECVCREIMCSQESLVLGNMLYMYVCVYVLRLRIRKYLNILVYICRCNVYMSTFISMIIRVCVKD